LTNADSGKRYLSPIETPKDSYVADYPQAVNAAITAQSVFWTAEELGVDKDESDVRTKLTAGERHGLMTVQSVITQYELMIGGSELWGNKIAKLFPRHEIQRVCATFAFFELGVHAPFYDLINKALNIATDEFYTAWKNDPILAERIRFIEYHAESDDALEVTAALAFLEGAVLFSAFAFFKSFNSRGFNLIPHFVAGIDGSAKDENFHSQFSSWLFRQCLQERTVAAGADPVKLSAALTPIIHQLAKSVYDHECRIIDMIFSKGDIRTISSDEMKHFVRDRVNVVCGYLGVKSYFEGEASGEVSSWFYDQLSTFKYSDFFTTTQLQYRRDWRKHELGFNTGEEHG
jgi:ribonucleotide reductase beta subunit family protein with ferritin-like domain